jgi:hypothetical protein
MNADWLPDQTPVRSLCSLTMPAKVAQARQLAAHAAPG